MKEIKEIRTIEEVVGYEAFDGTRFVDKDECIKYEKLTAEDVIKRKFADLIVVIVEEDEAITRGNYCDVEFVGSGCGEGNGLALVRIKDENDFNICNAYNKLMHPKIVHDEYGFTKDMIGKDVIVLVTNDYCGDNKETGNWELNFCMVYGTVEEQIRLYARRLKAAFTIN